MKKEYKRCVIIGGAEIGQYETVKKYLRQGDFIVCCDCGLRHRKGLGVEADLIVGDFDSAENPHLSVETLVLPREKDDTDTFFAAKEALIRGYENFLLLGVFGGRMDHTLANLSLMLSLKRQGARVLAVDDSSEFEIIEEGEAFVKDIFPFFSLLPLDGSAKGVTIQGAKYALTDAVLTSDFPLAVSNEPLPGQETRICVKSGSLLLIRDRR